MREAAPPRRDPAGVPVIAAAPAIGASAAAALSLTVVPFFLPSGQLANQPAVFFLALLFGYVNFCLFWNVFAPDLRPVALLMWLYFGYFFLLPAISQVSRNAYYWPSTVDYSETTVMIAAALVLVFFISFHIGGFLGRPAAPPRRSSPQVAPDGRETMLVLIVCIPLLLLAASAVARFGFGLFLEPRGSINTSLDDLSKVELGLLLDVPRAASFSSVMLSLLLLVRSRRPGVGGPERTLAAALAAIAIPLYAIVNFPAGLTRFWLFGMIIAFLLAFAPPKSRTARAVAISVVIVATYVVFPLANMTRNAANYDFTIKLPDLSDYLLNGDFDGMQSLMNVVRMTQDVGVLYGRQLLSVLLFFVPRTIFPFKGEPTGAVAADFAGYAYTNVSCPIVGELYADFALPGVLVGGILLGFLARRADAAYAGSVEGGELSVARLLCAVGSGFVVIISRGALLGIVGPIATSLAPYVAILLGNRALRGLAAHRKTGSAPARAVR